MYKRKIRDYIRLGCSLLFSWLYLPHLLIYSICGKHEHISRDIEKTHTDTLNLSGALGLLYLLHNNRYYRSLFYHRIGPVWSMLIGWWRPADRYFIISPTTKIGPGVRIAHPYATIINAESIGENFSCINCTTIGSKSTGRPTIGDNVTLGANVSVIGNVHIGNNVLVGAGSVVVKDLPDNAIAVGNPAKVVRYVEVNMNNKNK